MKILQIVSAGFEEGGVESGIVLMHPILQAKGHEDRIMASDRKMDMPRFEDYTFKAIDPNSVTRYVYQAFNPHSLRLLKKVLREYKPDVVQLHTMFELSPSVFLALKKVPTVLTIHGPEAFTPSLLMWYLPTRVFKDHSHHREQLTFEGLLHYFYHRYLTTSLYRVGMRNIDVVVASHYMQKLMEKDGISTTCIPHGIPLLDEKPLPDNETIAFAGRLEKFKGVDNLLRAMPDILRERPKARLLIAGDGSYRKEFEKIAHELKIIDNVEFLGHLSGAEVRSLYEKSVMLVVPSIWPEAFGKVGIEAMSVGRPVIASNVGGVSDWLTDGETGYLVPPGQPEALSKVVIELLSDRKKLERMAIAARKRSEDFSLDRYTDRMIEFYEKVIKKKASK